MTVSYTPKKTDPPIEIHITLGATPANRLAHPSFLTIICRAKMVLGLLARVDPGSANMILVLATSRGVVTAALNPPATAPHREDCQGDK